MCCRRRVDLPGNSLRRRAMHRRHARKACCLRQLVLHLHKLVVAQVVPKLQHRMLLVVRQGLRPKRSRLRHPQLAIQPNPD